MQCRNPHVDKAICLLIGFQRLAIRVMILVLLSFTKQHFGVNSAHFTRTFHHQEFKRRAAISGRSSFLFWSLVFERLRYDSGPFVSRFLQVVLYWPFQQFTSAFRDIDGTRVRLFFSSFSTMDSPRRYGISMTNLEPVPDPPLSARIVPACC